MLSHHAKDGVNWDHHAAELSEWCMTKGLTPLGATIIEATLGTENPGTMTRNAIQIKGKATLRVQKHPKEGTCHCMLSGISKIR